MGFKRIFMRRFEFMVGDNDSKFVKYEKYCKKCKHLGKAEYKEPCNECLKNPVRSGTEVPLKFEK